MEHRKISAFLLVPVAALIVSVFLASSGLVSLSSRAGTTYKCAAPAYSVELLSFNPLVIYINNFLHDEEVDHLLDVTKDRFKQSLVYDKDLKSYYDPIYRTSTSALISLDDALAGCLSERMKSFLGNLQHTDIEVLQVVKYEVGNRFRLHMDWFEPKRHKSHFSTSTSKSSAPDRPHGRLGSIFVYLTDQCIGGETYFPELPGVSPDADGDKFSRTDTNMGLLVRPRRGSAVFWNNLFLNGSGNPKLLHAGLPVKSGTKIGMNMFSYYYPDAPIVGASKD